MERKLQREIITFCKSMGAYVIKTRPGMGTPSGCPDLIVLFGPKHADIEVKASLTASYQPGQQATLDFLGKRNPYVWRVCPENWEEIKAELLANFF